jgi:hypothetical protein
LIAANAGVDEVDEGLSEAGVDVLLTVEDGAGL